MRRPLLAFALVFLASAAASCSNAADAPKDGGAGDAAIARPDGAPEVDAGDPDEGRPSLDPAALAARSAGGESHAAQVLTAVKGILVSFAEDDPTLDTAKSAGANADAVAARIAAEACGTASITHTAGSATVAVNFGAGCALASSGLTVAGSIGLAVTVTGGGDAGADAASDAGTRTVTLAFTFTGLTVEGTTLDGTVSVATSDLTTYALGANLTVKGTGAVTFTGTGSASAADGGASALAVTLDGAGTWTGATPTTLDGAGWSCAPSGPTTFTVTKLHRVASACYADAGKVTSSTPYACTTTVRGKQVSKTVTAQSTATFLTTTPATGEVTVSTASGDAGATTQTVKLPARSCLGGADAGPG